MKFTLRSLHLDRLFLRFFTGWCLAATVETLLNPYGFLTESFFNHLSLWRFIAVLAAVVAVMTVAGIIRDSAVNETRLMAGVALIYCLTLVDAEQYFYFALCLSLVLLFIGVYALQKDRLGLQSVTVSNRTVKILIAIAAVLFIGFSASVTVCRYLGYGSSTFDLGIFSQMFHYMKTTGLPLTTCEREGLLSHFAVHISPIWYLMLPFYALFPSPITLQILQSLILASAVIPLYLLAKKMGFSPKAMLVLCVCFCAFPALSGGQFYDVHENCFLTPLLFWMLYFFEKEKYLPMWGFAVLTLLVKEDAAIYVAAVALYMLCERKQYKLGVPLLLTAVVWFFAATAILSRFGDGEMSASRFGPYLIGDSTGMLSVLKTVFVNPGLLLFEIFQEDKIKFLLQMLVPLGFLPFFGKKLSRLILLIPMLLVNLMPDWEYQYSIFFQYVFGSTALLFYLTLLNLRDLSASRRRFCLPMIAAFTALIAVSQLSGSFTNVTHYFEKKESYEVITEELKKIPEDASVSAHGFYLPHVADREFVYDLSTDTPAEYVVIDLRSGVESDAEQLANYYRAYSDRYEEIAFEPNRIAIYRDRQYLPGQSK